MSETFKHGFIGVAGIAGAHAKHLQDVDGVEFFAAADIK
jgi:predicted dehydrogenase